MDKLAILKREKILILAPFAAVLAVVLSLPLLPTADTQGKATDHVVAPLHRGGQFRGIWLQLHNDDPGSPYEDYIEEIYRTGANTLCLTVSGRQENGRSTAIYVDRRSSPSHQRLAKLIQLAKAKDMPMRVILMPILLLTKPTAEEWRGNINPADWNEWWHDYRQFVLEYAGLAQRNGVELFMIGSELVTTEKYEKQWRELIRQVRSQSREILDEQFRQHLWQQFPGTDAAGISARLGITDIGTFAYSKAGDPKRMKAELVKLYDAFAGERRMLLSYSANWDHYTVPKWWDALDAVGMTSYYNLNESNEADPSLEQLAAAWKPIKRKIAAWQRTINKPIFFTEVGWASQDGCSIEPWNYYHSKKVDLIEQRRCMVSFLDAFGREPWVAGILIWKWRDHPGAVGGPKDYGYTPFRKPVMGDIERYFSSKDPSALAGPATRPAAAPLVGGAETGTTPDPVDGD